MNPTLTATDSDALASSPVGPVGTLEVPEAVLEAAATSLLEALALPVDRAHVRRRLLDASGADWRDRLAAALRPVGARVMSVQRSVADLVSTPPLTRMIAMATTAEGVEAVALEATSGGRKLQARTKNGATLVDAASLASVLGVAPTAQVPLVSAEHTHPLSHDHGSPHHHHPSPTERLLSLLSAERSDLWIIVVYAAAVGLLSLAFPVAVQSFVSTVAFGTLLQPIVVLALIVFGCLALAGMLRALQTVVVERLQERVFARAVLEMAHKLPHVELSALRGGEHPDPVNRFFDVLVIQKSLASLLLDGIAIVLSTVVGMMLLAFYHPFLLAFDVVLLVLIALVVLGLGRGGVRTSIYESKAKHAVASYLEDVVRNPMAFRLYPAMAAEKADDLARAYLVARRAHFRVVLRQSVGALALQALASAGLLAVGGWLVLERRLTLGQLVAAELVVGSVVAGVSKLGKHIETYYDLVASIDKLGHVLDLPLEHQGGALVPDSGGGCAVVAEGPVVERLTGARTLRLAPGQVTILPRREGDDAHSFGDACWGAEGDSIQVTLDGVHARDVPRDELRRVVAVVSEANAFASSVFDNVALARPWVGTAEVLSALRRSGLDRVVHELPQAADTELATGGAPLTSSQVTMLSIARAFAGRPRLLVLDGVLDSLPDDAVAAVLSSLGSAGRETTAVVLTNRKDLRSFAPGA